MGNAGTRIRRTDGVHAAESSVGKVGQGFLNLARFCGTDAARLAMGLFRLRNSGLTELLEERVVHLENLFAPQAELLGLEELH